MMVIFFFLFKIKRIFSFSFPPTRYLLQVVDLEVVVLLVVGLVRDVLARRQLEGRGRVDVPREVVNVVGLVVVATWTLRLVK